MVTGGAGYIGAHTSLLLAERGDHVVVVDDLATGSAARVPDLEVVRIDLAGAGAREAVAAVLRQHEIDAVVHFAARKQVGESVDKPAWYYQQNIGGLANLVLAMEDAGVGRLVFSSSAAVYGHTDGATDESHETSPVSPYGATKLAGEQLLAACAGAWGLNSASLRYFNVGGAGRPELGDTEALNLIPIVFDHLASGRRPPIFGDDYPTPDGTCVRDYVHVVDVAEAHLAVLDSLGSAAGHRAFNVGTGVGTSVLAMITRIIELTDSPLRPIVLARRPGDPASAVAVVDLIREQTGWSARFGIDEIVGSAWESRQYFRRTAAESGQRARP
jgi:UDP-glucose 4-epimerase